MSFFMLDARKHQLAIGGRPLIGIDGKDLLGQLQVAA